MTEWQPIGTAPKDIPVVVYVPVNRPERRVLVCDNTDLWGWGICGGSVLLGKPTHWRPLPSPPVEQAKSEVVG